MLKIFALLPLLIAGTTAVEVPFELVRHLVSRSLQKITKRFLRGAFNWDVTFKLVDTCPLFKCDTTFTNRGIQKDTYKVCEPLFANYCMTAKEPQVTLELSNEIIEKIHKIDFLPLRKINVTLDCVQEKYGNYRYSTVTNSEKLKMLLRQEVQYEPAVVVNSAPLIQNSTFLLPLSEKPQLMADVPTSLIFIGALAVLAVVFFLYRKKVQKVRAPLAMIQPKLLVQHHYPKDYENQVLVA